MLSMGYPRLERVIIAPADEWSRTFKGWTIARLNSGIAYCLDREQPRELAIGDSVLAASDAALLFRCSQIENAELNYFNFDPMHLSHFFTLPEKIAFAFAEKRLGKSVVYIPAAHPASMQFAAICEHWSEKDTFFERAHLLALVSTVFASDSVPKKRRSSPPAGSMGSHFEKLVHALPEAELLRMSLDSLARCCGCSPAYFGNIFRRKFGFSLRKRQFEFRMERAMWLLAETDAPIGEIAFESGYRETKIFSSIFRRHVGMSASAWRQRAQLGRENSNLPQKEPIPEPSPEKADRFGNAASVCFCDISPPTESPPRVQL